MAIESSSLAQEKKNHLLKWKDWRPSLSKWTFEIQFPPQTTFYHLFSLTHHNIRKTESSNTTQCLIESCEVVLEADLVFQIFQDAFFVERRFSIWIAN